MLNLKKRRIELGLTMLEVAKLVGVSEATISRYESGNIKNMRRDRIENYAKALQVSPSEFLDIDDEFIKTHEFLKTITDPERSSQQVKDKDAYIDSIIKDANSENHDFTDELKFALFDGAEGVTDEMFEEVKQFASMVKMREDAKKEKK